MLFSLKTGKLDWSVGSVDEVIKTLEAEARELAQN